MKKFLTLLCSICLIFPCIIILSGCKEDTPAPQITMVEIEDSLMDYDFSTYEKLDISRIDHLGNNKDTWNENLERQNIDATDLTVCDKYRVYYNREGINYQEAFLYVLKFSTIDAASNCKEYDLEEDTSMKTYGNLVVICDDIISEFVFGVIDAIEPK